MTIAELPAGAVRSMYARSALEIRGSSYRACCAWVWRASVERSHPCAQPSVRAESAPTGGCVGGGHAPSLSLSVSRAAVALAVARAASGPDGVETRPETPPPLNLT